MARGYRVTEFRFSVELDDGTTTEVEADQRDWAAMELLDLPVAAHIMRARHLAWHAMHRQGLTKLGWDEFRNQVVFVQDVTPAAEVEGEGEHGLDPGQRGTGDGRTSRSRGARASRSPKS